MWEEIINKGGPVVLILAGYSLVGLALVAERFLYFAYIGRPPGADFEKRMCRDLADGRPADLPPHLRGPEVTVVRGMLTAAGEKVRDLSRVASRLGSAELQKMERGFRTLAVLGNTAPLLGLFGTIIGMIKAFMVIEQAGGRVDAQALAGGIWEALLTTGVGLAVAIPILLLLHLLEGMADRRARTMHGYASLVLEKLAPANQVFDDPLPQPRTGEGENAAF